MSVIHILTLQLRSQTKIPEAIKNAEGNHFVFGILISRNIIGRGMHHNIDLMIQSDSIKARPTCLRAYQSSTRLNNDNRAMLKSKLYCL